MLLMVMMVESQKCMLVFSKVEVELPKLDGPKTRAEIFFICLFSSADTFVKDYNIRPDSSRISRSESWGEGGKNIFLASAGGRVCEGGSEA